MGDREGQGGVSGGVWGCRELIRCVNEDEEGGV